ncbi:hypothetical protein BGZ58_008591 [Dissophora ornata]|nr:hypothetical protein BGZ58_008591 [Dissophora ornata]
MTTKRKVDQRDTQPREQDQLADTMAANIFGPTPNLVERTACKFAAELTVATSPVLSPEAFVDFVKGQLPTARNKDLVWTWTSLRAHISEHGQDPLKVAFKNAALLTPDEVTRLWDAINDAEQEQEHKKDETKAENLQEFKGKLWTVTSGTVVDIDICSHVLSLKKESSLHSLVIDNAKTVIQLFTGKDKEEVAQVLEERGDEEQDTEDEQAFVARYLSAPKATGFALSRGWLGSTEEDDALDEDQREWLFKAMHDIYTVYKCCAFRLPLEEKESWYMTTLWSFLLPFLNEGNALVYRPGEAVSEASVLRKNAARTLEIRRVYRHKIDGLISSTTMQLEFGGIEAAKTDEGAQSTKTLMDTRKLAKLLKDMHDCIVSKTDDPNALHELETFGL